MRECLKDFFLPRVRLYAKQVSNHLGRMTAPKVHLGDNVAVGGPDLVALGWGHARNFCRSSSGFRP